VRIQDAVTYRVRPATSDRLGSDADPITTEVIRRGLNAAAEQMKITLRRTAFSPVIYEMYDFACALYDADVRLLAQAETLPGWLGTMNFVIEGIIATIGGPEHFEPDDVLFSTYGYDIGAHPQDAAVVLPIFIQGELMGYAVVKAHQMDIGAKQIYCTDTTDNFQEGTIFPGVWLYRRGVLQGDMYRTILANSRMPAALAGDLSAEIASATVGAQVMRRIVERHGKETFRECVERMFAHGEAVVRSFFERIPDGVYVAQGALDSNGVTNDIIPFEVSVEVTGSDIVVDFSNAPEQQGGPVNAPLPMTVSCARYTMMSLAGGGAREFVNEGHLRPIAVRTRPGTLFHALPPAPIFLYAFPARVACDNIHRALSEAMPNSVPAGSGGCLLGLVWWGTTDDGKFWGGATDHFVGQGAYAGKDGGAPLMHIAVSGIRNTAAEVIEARHPLVVRKFELAQDSGGAGRWRGGVGVDIHYEVDRDAYLTCVIERSKTAPWGLFGGGSARANIMRVRFPDGSVGAYSKITGLALPKGSVVEVSTGGGGGYDPASERQPVDVLNDIADGYISDAAARLLYPQCFRSSVDRSATGQG
jgi:N-methylhydantoinase B